MTNKRRYLLPFTNELDLIKSCEKIISIKKSKAVDWVAILKEKGVPCSLIKDTIVVIQAKDIPENVCLSDITNIPELNKWDEQIDNLYKELGIIDNL